MKRADLCHWVLNKPRHGIQASNAPSQSKTHANNNAKVLEGATSISGGECALFIDIIGCPRTPMSYAGAARRAYRR